MTPSVSKETNSKSEILGVDFFFKIERQFIRDRHLKNFTQDAAGQDALVVLLVLRDYENLNTHECYPTYETIIDLTDLSRQRISNGIDRLMLLGYISKVKKNGRNNLYSILDYNAVRIRVGEFKPKKAGVNSSNLKSAKKPKDDVSTETVIRDIKPVLAAPKAPAAAAPAPFETPTKTEKPKTENKSVESTDKEGVEAYGAYYSLYVKYKHLFQSGKNPIGLWTMGAFLNSPKIKKLLEVHTFETIAKAYKYQLDRCEREREKVSTIRDYFFSPEKVLEEYCIARDNHRREKRERQLRTEETRRLTEEATIRNQERVKADGIEQKKMAQFIERKGDELTEEDIDYMQLSKEELKKKHGWRHVPDYSSRRAELKLKWEVEILPQESNSCLNAAD